MKLANELVAARWHAKRQTQLLQPTQQHLWLTRFKRFGIISPENYRPAILRHQSNLEGTDVYQKRRPTTKRQFYEPCAATPVRHWEWYGHSPLPTAKQPVAIDASCLIHQPTAMPRKAVHRRIIPAKLRPADCAPTITFAAGDGPSWQPTARTADKLAVEVVATYQLTKPHYDPNARAQACRRGAQALTSLLKRQRTGMFNITDFAPVNEN